MRHNIVCLAFCMVRSEAPSFVLPSTQLPLSSSGNCRYDHLCMLGWLADYVCVIHPVLIYGELVLIYEDGG